MLKKLKTLVIIANVVLASTQLILTFTRSGEGEKLSELNSKATELALENQRLQFQVLARSNTQFLWEKAQSGIHTILAAKP